MDRDTRSGVLVMPLPESGWSVLEVDVSDGELRADLSRPITSGDVSGALSAAFDVLTLMTEGRLPTMHEFAQESVRSFVRELESHGYDREAALRILLDMVDRRASRPPKAKRMTQPASRG
ncbi:MAG TPA: hypothetical protein VFB58_19085 [Chloroflexota bacterium]|nr:hypothetical protein [Chloroflexota bacterium]